MKYIDADNLSEKLKHYLDIQPATDGLPRKYSYEARGVKQAIDYALSLVKDSQQEQREGLHFIPLNRLIQKIPSENWNDTVNNYAKKLCDCLIKEGYLKDADVLQGYISYMNGNNVPMATMDEQEQPEVDLDFQVFAKEMDAVFNLPKDVTENTEENPLNWEYAIARHFYELGRNARKED